MLVMHSIDIELATLPLLFGIQQTLATPPLVTSTQYSTYLIANMVKIHPNAPNLYLNLQLKHPSVQRILFIFKRNL